VTNTADTARFADLVAASEGVAATRSRLAKTATLAEFFERVSVDELSIAIAFLSGSPRQDKLGVGWATVREIDVAPADHPSLTLAVVDECFDALASAAGPGSKTRRRELLRDLFADATGAEQDLLSRLILGNLRQGATEGLMIDALATAAAVSPELMRRAAMLSGSVVDAGVVALTDGAAGLDAIRLELFRPVAPMLASTAEDVAAGVAAFGEASVEAKLDGARVQVHRRGDEVVVYTRNLNDITARVPEIVEVVRSLPFAAAILDGEAVSLRPDGQPQPFQVTMGRFGTEGDEPLEMSRLALVPVFFDILFADGRSMLDEPLETRHETLDQIPPEFRVRRIRTDDPTRARQFMDETLVAGHEGVMVKDPESAYAAGRRGKAWLKVKPAHTLDLVVLAVEWGSGRREGWLSNLHLGARGSNGDFVMLGKTFKGMTDAMLAWQTERFLELETHREGHVVYVRPEQVVEIAFDGIQSSSRYPGGMALRFARVKGYRADKTVAEADTIDTVRTIFERSSS
jgi:DNA ligase-1